jgi:phosphoserine aminotransferase
MTEIRIPAELLPGDGRFCSGPSKVRPEAVAALAEAAPAFLGTSHRRDAVRSVVGRVRTGVSELFGLPDGYEVVIGVGGAAAFWDAAVFGLIAERSQHLVFGEFSSKFAQAAAAAPHLKAPDIIESPPGSHPQPAVNPEVDAYAFTHNETSTGVVMPVSRPDGEGLVLVDATSAAGAVEVNPQEFDVYYFSTQKVFAADAGLWVAACSPRATDRIERIAAGGRWIPTFLSLTEAVANSRKNQTYNTPPLVSVFLLAHTLDWILSEGGLSWSVGRCARSAEILYGWAEERVFAAPFVDDPAKRSPTVATIDFTDDVDAAALAATLRANGILDTEPYRKLQRNQLRIALFPAIDPSDVERLTRCIDHVVERLSG